MRELSMRALDFIIPLFAASSMLSVGLAHSFQELLAPLRNLRLISGALVANFVLVPLLALLISFVLPLTEPFKAGLFLLAMAAGASFLIRLTYAARGDLATSTALLTVLLVATIVFMPIFIPLALPGTAVNSASIALSLILTMLLPLSAGIAGKQWRPELAGRLQPIANRTSIVSLVGLIALTVLAHLHAILDLFGTGAILAALLLTGGAFLIGHLVGRVDSRHRGVLGLATAQRNIAAATVVALENFDHPDVLVMVVIASLVSILVLFPVAWGLRRNSLGAAQRRRRVPHASKMQPTTGGMS